MFYFFIVKKSGGLLEKENAAGDAKNFGQRQVSPEDSPFAMHAILRQGIYQACLQIKFAAMLQEDAIGDAIVAQNIYGVTKAAVSGFLSLSCAFTGMAGRVGGGRCL